MPIRPTWKRAATKPTMPSGERIYAIGDIHGRFDLLFQLMRSIVKDVNMRPRAQKRIVILGDFIDRGPNSAKIIEALSALSADDRMVVLKGNHEAALVDGIRGDRSALEAWIDFGGDATLRSFGARDDDIWPADTRKLVDNVRRIIPPAVVDWLESLPVTYRAGSYLFVHAGIKPGVALTKQHENDLLWVRDEFTSSTADHGAIVVHGHTISARVCVEPNRIGVDTGAYRTGRLSAVALEGGDHWIIEASQAKS